MAPGPGVWPAPRPPAPCALLHTAQELFQVLGRSADLCLEAQPRAAPVNTGAVCSAAHLPCAQQDPSARGSIALIRGSLRQVMRGGARVTVLGLWRPQLVAQIHSILPRTTFHVACALRILSPMDLHYAEAYQGRGLLGACVCEFQTHISPPSQTLPALSLLLWIITASWTVLSGLEPCAVIISIVGIFFFFFFSL